MKRKFSYVFNTDYNLETDSKDEKNKENKEDGVDSVDSNDMNSTNSKQKISKSESYYNENNSSLVDVTIYKNHIYFYGSVTKKSCLKLNISLREISQKIIDNGINLINKDRYIYLHINSFGGSVFSALSTIDTIKNLKIPVVSIIEGGAASAATMISVCCSYRIIHKNSFMLIHQLSSGCWGKMNQLEDEMENLKKLMHKIKSLYKEYTKIDEEQLDDILKRDIWWDSKKCLNEGLVDEISENELIYQFDKSNLDF